MARTFGITFDYRCPYGRIVHDHVYEGLKAGATWDVTFLPFNLGQSHVEEGMPDVWDAPERDTGILSQQLALSLRDNQPEVFLDVHHALYEHRHTNGGNIRDWNIIADIARAHGADVDAALADIESGRVLSVVKNEHTKFVQSHQVWGVPTFIVGESAVFVRLLDRADGDGTLAIDTIERILDNIEWTTLNEFKHTSIPR